MARSVVVRKCGKLASFFFSDMGTLLSRGALVSPTGRGLTRSEYTYTPLKVLIQVHDVVPFDTSWTCYAISVNPQILCKFLFKRSCPFDS